MLRLALAVYIDANDLGLDYVVEIDEFGWVLDCLFQVISEM